jgi:BirA family biotin operon repressor/biotin-[acetyl-CoA-carboxylase] ligase
MESLMAFTCVVLVASQMIKKSATDSGIFLRSRETIFSAFLAWMAFMMVLKSLEFLVRLEAVLLGRAAKTDNGANNQTSLIMNNCSFAWSKIINLLPVKPSNYIIGEPFTEFTSVDSTNNYAMAFVQNGGGMHGMAWFAHEQTAGKGQRGKQWSMQHGQNIMLSVLLDASWLTVSAQFSLSMAVALGVHDFFAAHAGDETKIKWPNDLYWRDRKAGGILIENQLKGNIWQWAVAGMGININQVTFEGLQNPVSLRQITGKTFDTVALARQLCSHLEQRYRQLQNPQQAATLLEEYNSILFKKNEKVRLKKENQVFECVIDHVDQFGQLHVQHPVFQSFTHGEIQWIL